jgi:hypothetical protein
MVSCRHGSGPYDDNLADGLAVDHGLLMALADDIWFPVYTVDAANRCWRQQGSNAPVDEVQLLAGSGEVVLSIDRGDDTALATYSHRGVVMLLIAEDGRISARFPGSAADIAICENDGWRPLDWPAGDTARGRLVFRDAQTLLPPPLAALGPRSRLSPLAARFAVPV